MNILHLPVSLGEAIDKLSILEIKLDHIKDSRRDDVKVEYDMLHTKLHEIITKYTVHYQIMKTVNLEIWNMMDSLRDKDLSGEDYLNVCRECIEANDVRFRIKNKINNLANSVLKEQKGYSALTCVLDIKYVDISIGDNSKKIQSIITYYSFLYDETIVITNTPELIQKMSENDPTIKIHNGKDCNNIVIKKYIIADNSTIEHVFNELYNNTNSKMFQLIYEII